MTIAAQKCKGSVKFVKEIDGFPERGTPGAVTCFFCKSISCSLIVPPVEKYQYTDGRILCKIEPYLVFI